MMCRICFVVLLGLSTLSGCGGNPNLGQVTGTIKLDGEPLPDAMVVFIPGSGGTTSYGKSDASGNYKMMFNDNEAGSWIGTNKVEIRTGDVLPDNSGVIPEKVPNVYNSRSTLTADVVSGKNTIDFDLKSDASPIDRMRSGY